MTKTQHEPLTGVCVQCSSAIIAGSREIVVRSTGDGKPLALCHEDCLHKWLRRGPAQ